MVGIRPVAKLVQAHRQREGGGFVVRRPFPGQEVSEIDPFLLLDEMGPADYGPGEAVGAPDHPHRGFETVTYMLEGEFEHKDSAGHQGKLRPGDVQWMTAGAGVVHSEMPSERIVREGGRVHGFQLWVNLPARDKMIPPHYQEIPGEGLPRARTQEGLAEGVILAGEALGARAVIETRTPILFQDWTIRPGGVLELPVPDDFRVVAYVFRGSVLTGPEGHALGEGQLAIFGQGDRVRLEVGSQAEQDGRLLLLGGKPLNEPVARYGPFVMNTKGEIRQAILDFQTGKLGAIPPR